MRELILLLLLLAACDGRLGDDRGPAELYRDALSSTSWEEGQSLCARLPAADRPDCLVATMDAQGRLEAADCDGIPVGVWQHECVFLYAEREARAGNLAEAFAACESTSFGRECTFHLIREGAREVVGSSVSEAASAAVPYTGLPRAPDAQRLFWRTWFKEGMEAKRPIDPTGCPSEDCVEGARETMLLALTSLARADGAGFCEGPPPDGRKGARALWVEGPLTVAWVTEFVDGACRRGR